VIQLTDIYKTFEVKDKKTRLKNDVEVISIYAAVAYAGASRAIRPVSKVISLPAMVTETTSVWESYV